VQGNAGFIARFPVFLPFSEVPGWTVPATKNDASMYGTVGTAGSGFYGNLNSDLGITRIAAGLGEWSPFECGTACYNATHYLWGITATVLDFVELLKLSGLQYLDKSGYEYRLSKLANATTGDTTWVSGVNITFDASIKRDVLGLTFILELHPREGVYPIWCALFLL